MLLCWGLNSYSHYRGFDHCFTIGSGYPLEHWGRQTFYRNGEPVSLKGHKAQLITDDAVDYLRSVDHDKPFFMYVGYYETLSDWNNHPERLVHKCRKNSFADIPEGETYDFGEQNLESTNPTRNDREETLAQYYASVAQIDETVGRVMDELDAMGKLDDTLIIYTSNHGLNCSHHDVWGKGNGTFPLNMLEESVRIPMLLRCPGEIDAGVVRREFADQTDLSTVTPAPYHTGWKKTQFGEYGMLRMARNDRYKLVLRNSGMGVGQLFDLKYDPRENINLFDHPNYQNTITQLSSEMDDFFGRYEDEDNSGLNVLNLQQHNWTEAWRFRRFSEPIVNQ